MFLNKLFALVALSFGMFLSDNAKSIDIVDSNFSGSQSTFKIYESKEISTGDLLAYTYDLSSNDDICAMIENSSNVSVA